MKAEDHSRDPSAGEVGANFPESFAKGPPKGIPTGQAILKALQILANDLPVFGRQLLKPFAHRLASGNSAEEDQRYFGGHIAPTYVYHKKYNRRNAQLRLDAKLTVSFL